MSDKTPVEDYDPYYVPVDPMDAEQCEACQ